MHQCLARVIPQALCECQLTRLGQQLDVAKFSYNLQKSESTNRSLFEIIIGRQPTTPNSLATGYDGSNPVTYKFAKSWQEQADLACTYLGKVYKKVKKFANHKQRRVEFFKGDKVMLKFLP